VAGADRPDYDGAMGTGRRLLLAGLALVGLFALGTFAERSAYFDAWFGLEAWQKPGVPAFLLSSLALLVVLSSPRRADRLADFLARLAHLVPRRLREPLLLVSAGAATLVLTNYQLSGDGPNIMLGAQFGLGEIYPSHALTAYLHSAIVDLLGLDGREAVRLVSCASGVVYTAAALRIGRECFEDPGRRAGATALLLLTGTAALFFGTLEVYPTLAAGTAVYLLVGLRHLRKPGRFPWPPLVLGITFGLHGLAGVLLPSLLFLANDGAIRPFRWGRWLRWGAMFLVPVLLLFAALYFLTWSGAPPDAGPSRYGTFLGVDGHSPLLTLRLTPTNLTHRYALLDLEHFVGVLNVLFLGGGAALLLLLSALRWPTREPSFRFVGVVAIPLLIFPFVWNVSYGLRQDWDLFSLHGIPLALLAALAFLPRVTRPGHVLGAALVAGFAFVPFVVSNHVGQVDHLNYALHMETYFEMAGRVRPDPRHPMFFVEDPDHANARNARDARSRWRRRVDELDILDHRALMLQAIEAIDRDRPEEAEALYREVLRNSPRHATALASLGRLLVLVGGRDREARDLLHAAVREDPTLLRAWAALAEISLTRGRPDEAVRQLERGIRYGPLQASAAEAARFLAAIHRRNGRPEIAAEVLELAEDIESRQR
jgi:hypothetical protein